METDSQLRELVPSFNWEQYSSDPFYLDKITAA
jgi:hypothetical protein